MSLPLGKFLLGAQDIKLASVCGGGGVGGSKLL